MSLPYICITPLESDPLCITWANLLREMDKVFFISQFGTDEAIKAGVDAEHIEVGIDTKAWRLRTEEEYKKIRASLGFDDDDFVVMTVADNQERKNLGRGLQIIAELKKQGVSAKHILVTREQSQVGWKLYDLAFELGISSDLRVFQSGMPFRDLYTLYCAADAYLCCSKGEGLGIPIMEAMCCFTENTNIWAENVEKGLRREYSGDLVKIEIGEIVIESTPEHPFWTSRGWQYAGDLVVGDQLLYNPVKQKNQENKNGSPKFIHTGRIKSVVEVVQNKNDKKDSKNNEEVLLFNRLAQAPSWIEKTNQTKNSSSSIFFIGNRLGLFGWNNRRRRDSNNQEDGRKKEGKLEAPNTNFKHVATAFRVAVSKIKSAIISCSEKKYWVEKFSALLHILRSRFVSVESLQEVVTVHENKVETHGVYNRVYRTSTTAIKSRPSYGSPKKHYTEGEGVEFKTITKISKRTAVNIDVYNLKTESGLYFSEGFLVHNCGIPVVANKTGAIPELLSGERGWIADYKAWQYDPFGNQRRYDIDISSAVGCLLEIREQKEWVKDRTRRAREFMESRSWERSTNQLHAAIEKVLNV